MTRDQIVQRARHELGVKWQHQAALTGVACDCVGLIRLVGGEFGLVVDDGDVTYGRMPRSTENELYEKCKKYLTEIPLSDIKPGDIILFKRGRLPARHIGIMSYDDFVIHTWMDVNKVVEMRLDDQWRGYMTYAFRFPGVED